MKRSWYGSTCLCSVNDSDEARHGTPGQYFLMPILMVAYTGIKPKQILKLNVIVQNK